MSKALVIGSTVCDIMVYLDRLPSREGDAHIYEQTWSLGGLPSMSSPFFML